METEKTFPSPYISVYYLETNQLIRAKYQKTRFYKMSAIPHFCQAEKETINP